MALFEHLHRIAHDDNARADIAQVLEQLNLQIGLTFIPNPRGKKPKKVLGSV